MAESGLRYVCGRTALWDLGPMLAERAPNAIRRGNEGPMSTPPMAGIRSRSAAITARDQEACMLQPEFDLPSPIDVFRDSPANEKPRARHNDAPRDPREQRIQELGERVRDAVVRQRVAEAVGERLEGALKERVREVLRTRFMRDVRTALRDVAMAKSDPDDVGELLDDALSDIIEDRVRDVLREHLGTAVRERASDAIRGALADTPLTGNLSP